MQYKAFIAQNNGFVFLYCLTKKRLEYKEGAICNPYNKGDAKPHPLIYNNVKSIC